MLISVLNVATPQFLVYALGDARPILDLRHRVLRAGLPPETAMFDGDDDPSTEHLAVFAKEFEIPLCCVSFMLNEYEGQRAYQLRGMAADPVCRGWGLGTELLETAEYYLSTLQQTKILWCNARMDAIWFYKKNGWQCVSDTFDIPTAGPHRRMVKKI